MLINEIEYSSNKGKLIVEALKDRPHLSDRYAQDPFAQHEAAQLSHRLRNNRKKKYPKSRKERELYGD